MTLNEILWGSTDKLGAFEFVGIIAIIAAVCYVIYRVVKYIYDNICRLYQYTAKCTCKDCKYRNRDEFCLKFKCIMSDDSYCNLAEKKDCYDSLNDYSEIRAGLEKMLKEK